SKLKLAVSFFFHWYFLLFLLGILFSVPGMAGARLTKTRASSGLALIWRALLPLYKFSVRRNVFPIQSSLTQLCFWVSSGFFSTGIISFILAPGIELLIFTIVSREPFSVALCRWISSLGLKASLPWPISSS